MIVYMVADARYTNAVNLRVNDLYYSLLKCVLYTVYCQDIRPLSLTRLRSVFLLSQLKANTAIEYTNQHLVVSGLAEA